MASASALGGLPGEGPSRDGIGRRQALRGLLHRMAAVQITSMVPGEPATSNSGECDPYTLHITPDILHPTPCKPQTTSTHGGSCCRNVGVRVQRTYVDADKSFKTISPLFDRNDLAMPGGAYFEVPQEVGGEVTKP